MKYEAPQITDLGSIAEHTFTNNGGGTYTGPGNSQASPPKDTDDTCKLDKFAELSCAGS